MSRISYATCIEGSHQRFDRVGSPNCTVCCMTRHPIEGPTKAMAVELATMGIRVNATAPTFIATPMPRPMLENTDVRSCVLASIPLREPGQVHDVAVAAIAARSCRARRTVRNN